MSNGSTDVFFDVLTLAGCDVARTAWEQNLVLYFADGHRTGMGASGFDLAEQLHRSAEAEPSPMILISTQAEADFTDLISASPAIGFLAKFAITPAAVRDLVDGSVGLDGDRR